MKRLVWVLNLGVEDEFAGRATQSHAARERIKSPEILSALKPLITPAGVVLAPSERYDGFQGRAFSPTPSALGALRNAGATVQRAPSIDVLRQVNHRGFWRSSATAQSLPGSCFVEDEDTAWRTLSRRAISGAWVVKRAFGFAARGQRRLLGKKIEDNDRAWIRRSLKEGGVQIEPWVDRISDHAIHGYITPNGSAGSVTLGTPTAQACDADGRWQSSMPSPLSPADAHTFRSVAETVAHELGGAGYFGPFGIDAFRWRRPNGTIEWQWHSDVNARYTMGWALGMGENRPDIND